MNYRALGYMGHYGPGWEYSEEANRIIDERNSKINTFATREENDAFHEMMMRKINNLGKVNDSTGPTGLVDVELPPDNPNEWKECPNCTRLKKEIVELRKDAEYTIQVLKERKQLQDQIKECRKQTLIDVQKMIMGNAYNFKNKDAEFICKRIQNMML